MLAVTPADRAIATYSDQWRTASIAEPRLAVVNPETLDDSTHRDFTFRYIDISSVSEEGIDWSAVPRLRFVDAPSRARRVVRPGDTMICTVRPLLQSHAFASWTEQEATVCSTGFAVVRCTKELVPIFVKHLPFSEQVTRQLSAWQCGTNYPAVNERDIRRLVIPVPSPTEQMAIAGILDAVDAALEHTRTAIDRARELKRAVLQQFFYEALGETAYADRPRRKLPPGWSLELTEVLLAEDPKNGISPETSSQPPGTATFSIAAIRESRVDLASRENLKYARIPDSVAERYLIRRGDILIVRGNANPELVGRAGMVSDCPAGCIYPDITKRVVFRNDSDPSVLPEFAVLAWNHAIVHNQLLRRAKTSNGTLKINNRDVKQVIMPVPPPKAQAELVHLTRSLDSHADTLAAVSVAQQTLKRALMHELLTGQVRVNTPSKVVAL
jgi:type I restriction enzyme, S subunit